MRGSVGLAAAVESAQEQLRVVAPGWVAGFREAVPWAARVVAARLVDALCREDVGAARAVWGGRGRWYGFDRFVVDERWVADPWAVLPVELLAGRRGWALAAELTDAVVHLAVAAARPPVAGPAGGSGGPEGPDGWAVWAERQALTGHNLHPCGRTRLGWSVADAVAHDVGSPATRVGFVAVRRDLHVGDDVGAWLRRWYPQVPAAPPGWVVQPVHVWQGMRVVARRYADLVAAGVVRLLPQVVSAVPTAAVRTVLLPAGVDGRRRYLKVSLDIQVTSTRRTISVASTRNGPVLSSVLSSVVADDEVAAARLVLLPEVAGAAVPVGSGRDVSAIVREGLVGRLVPGEVAVPGVALVTGRELVARVAQFGRVRGLVGAAAGLGFVAAYVSVVVPPVLRLATRFGVALEAHLQNCLPTFRGGVPFRLVVRDFAGLRLARPRLAAAGVSVGLAPGSVVATDDVAVMRAKVGYTLLQAHVGEVVRSVVDVFGVDEVAAWRVVRSVVDETYGSLRGERGCAGWAVEDHAAFTAPLVAHKALVRMRLAGSGDLYVPVRNPISDVGFDGGGPGVAR
ncbi:IucA/IucC family protein [Solwaraspora sp. WMMD791]|uniref:IucA/IucC family protein n=1 Tax=Solwaraspora sp. WMMD791 TaxID=3016086 RepID=UPI00249A60CD|nr:IucA/IucC family protein [Solwaraspora sp. WMMD791]WFE28468.1 IucA/IucC family protein [Solwaraspora sp. WMMD791]